MPMLARIVAVAWLSISLFGCGGSGSPKVKSATGKWVAERSQPCGAQACYRSITIGWEVSDDGTEQKEYAKSALEFIRDVGFDFVTAAAPGGTAIRAIIAPSVAHLMASAIDESKYTQQKEDGVYIGKGKWLWAWRMDFDSDAGKAGLGTPFWLETNQNIEPNCPAELLADVQQPYGKCKDGIIPLVACGDGYSYSHNGWWSNAQDESTPYGKVIAQAETTVAQCRAACEKVEACAGFSLWGYKECWIYHTIDSSESAGSDYSVACVKATCGDGYSYSHDGWWSNAQDEVTPYGKVMSQAGTTVAQCRAACAEVEACAGFNLWGNSDCWIYHTIGSEVSAGSGSDSVACVKDSKAAFATGETQVPRVPPTQVPLAQVVV